MIHYEVWGTPTHRTTRRWLALYVIDTVGIVHAILLRIQVLLLLFKALVLGGGH